MSFIRMLYIITATYMAFIQISYSKNKTAESKKTSYYQQFSINNNINKTHKITKDLNHNNDKGENTNFELEKIKEISVKYEKEFLKKMWGQMYKISTNINNKNPEHRMWDERRIESILDALYKKESPGPLSKNIIEQTKKKLGQNND